MVLSGMGYKLVVTKLAQSTCDRSFVDYVN